MLTANPNTILIVDDQPTNLKMLFSFLQESGFKVLVAQTGESAIKKLEKVSPDLILLDVMLPGLDGFETCRRLKATAQTKDIPVIFMTALSESMDRIKGLKVGAVDYITKPFQQEEVLARIENQLQLRRLQKQLEDQNQQLQQEIKNRRKIEERLQVVIQAANDGFWDWNLESGDIYISPRCKEMLGYADEELPNELSSWEDHVFPDDKITALKLLDDYTCGKVPRFESLQRFRHKNGSTVYILVRGLRLKERQGKASRMVGAYTDITEMTQATEALQQSQLLLAGVLNSSLDGVAAFSALRDSQGNIVDFIWLLLNPAAEKMVGHPQSELLGKPMLVTMPGIRVSGLFEQFVTVVESTDALETELYYAHDNIQAWLQIAAVKLDDGFAMTFRDITQRKQIEAALQESQRWLSAITEANPNILYVYDRSERRNIYCNRQMFAILGYSSDEIQQMGAEVLAKLMHPDDFALLAEHENRYETAQDGQTFEFEYRMRHKNGKWRWLNSRDTVFTRDSDGNPKQILGTATDISDRKAIEIALQQSEARLQKLAASVPGMLYEYLLHPDGSSCFTYVSSVCREINEMEPEQLLENPALGFEITHPDDRQRLCESIHTSGQTLEPWVWEGRIITPSGRLKWVRGGARPERYANGDILWHGLVVDVSDRKQVELELQTAKAALEQQIQRVLLQERITHEIRSTLKPQQIFQTAADQIGQTFGVSRCIIHTYITQPFPRIPQVAEYLEPGYASMQFLEIPVVGNAHAQLVLSQDQAVKSDDVYNDPLLVGMSDILRQLDLKSVLVVRTSYQGKPNGIICLEQCDDFRHWTEDEINLLEAVAVQMGIALAQANLLEQEKQQRQELARQNHALEKAKLEAEAANRAKSQFLSKMSHELRTPLNAILGFTQVMARDESITREQKDYLGIINRSGEHLLELINDILSMSKIEAGQVTLNTSRFDLYRLLDSLEEMLRLKATSKGIELFIERAPDVPQYIETDDNKLRQVLINLLGNAIKFTQTGHVMLRVTVGEYESTKTREILHSNPELSQNLHLFTPGVHPATPSGNATLRATGMLHKRERLPLRQTLHEQPTRSLTPRLLFEVEDTGPGIAPEEMGMLFNPFVQTETGRKSMEGTGLGLPISQQFVRMMGGEISVSSTLGQGTTFTFDIQVGVATSADDKPISTKQRIIGLEPNQPSYRILVVEDAAVNRKLLVKILEPLGFEVRTATDGQEAIAVWQSWSPHLIWMDVIMPTMDGYEATKQIKQSPNGQSTIIIALTANAFEEQQEAILNAGCDDFLPKPFKREVLLEKMAHHLGVRYIYEQQTTPTLLQSPNPGQSLTPDALAVMPTSWVTQLHQAALYADDELMKQLIAQIPLKHDRLRQALRALIDNFLLEQIINLTESARP
jgi:two-component system, sensor histidine kinase and response regulator